MCTHVRQTDEPLYAHFLKKRPTLFRDEREATMKSQSSDWNEVVEKVLMAPYDTPVVMHKVRTRCFSLFRTHTHTFTHFTHARCVVVILSPFHVVLPCSSLFLHIYRYLSLQLRILHGFYHIHCLLACTPLLLL